MKFSDRNISKRRLLYICNNKINVHYVCVTTINYSFYNYSDKLQKIKCKIFLKPELARYKPNDVKLDYIASLGITLRFNNCDFTAKPVSIELTSLDLVHYGYKP